MKRQTVEWKKRFANHMSDKYLIFNICKELIKLIAKMPSDFKLNRKTEYTFFPKKKERKLSRLVMSDSFQFSHHYLLKRLSFPH